MSDEDALTTPIPLLPAARRPATASAAQEPPTSAFARPPPQFTLKQGLMGPPAPGGVPSTRSKVINEQFDRLLDKSPVPRSISRAFNAFQEPQLRDRRSSERKRTLAGFTTAADESQDTTSAPARSEDSAPPPTETETRAEAETQLPEPSAGKGLPRVSKTTNDILAQAINAGTAILDTDPPLGEGDAAPPPPPSPPVQQETEALDTQMPSPPPEDEGEPTLPMEVESAVQLRKTSAGTKRPAETGDDNARKSRRARRGSAAPAAALLEAPAPKRPVGRPQRKKKAVAPEPAPEPAPELEPDLSGDSADAISSEEPVKVPKRPVGRPSKKKKAEPEPAQEKPDSAAEAGSSGELPRLPTRPVGKPSKKIKEDKLPIDPEPGLSVSAAEAATSRTSLEPALPVSVPEKSAQAPKRPVGKTSKKKRTIEPEPEPEPKTSDADSVGDATASNTSPKLPPSRVPKPTATPATAPTSATRKPASRPASVATPKPRANATKNMPHSAPAGRSRPSAIVIPETPAPSAAISRQLGLDIPAAILAATGSSWDPLSGRRHSRRNTVLGVTPARKKAVADGEGSRSAKAGKVGMGDGGGSAKRRSRGREGEVPDSEPRRVKLAESEKVREGAGKRKSVSDEVSETPVRAKVAKKQRTEGSGQKAAAGGKLSSAEKEKGRAKMKTKSKESGNGKGKEARKLPATVAEKDPYEFSDDE